MAFRMMSSTFGKYILPSLRISQASFARSTMRVSSAGPGGMRQALLGVAPCSSRSVLPMLSRECSTKSPTASSNHYGLDDVKMNDVKVDMDNKQLLVSWANGESQIYPFVWLRDNCRCQACFHPRALNRLTLLDQLNVEVLAESVELSPDAKTLTIQWEGDDHRSQFPSHWLLQYRFEDSSQDRLLDPKRQLWGSEVNFQRFDFGDLLVEDGALYDWLTELVSLGVAVVENASSEIGQLHKLAARVAFIRPIVYGSSVQVKAVADPLHSAFTPSPLAMHTDIAYYMHEAGVVMLHCIEEAKGTGGQSLISDGFKVASDLRRADPDAFHLLCKYPIEFFDTGRAEHGEFHMHARHKTIRLDDRGEIEAISFSDFSRAPMLRAPVNQVLPMYRALSKFYNLLLAPETYQKNYKLKAGEILTLNNHRALHGRTTFHVTEARSRHLEVGYIGWDEVNSRIRVLEKHLQS